MDVKKIQSASEGVHKRGAVRGVDLKGKDGKRKGKKVHTKDRTERVREGKGLGRGNILYQAWKKKRGQGGRLDFF